MLGVGERQRMGREDVRAPPAAAQVRGVPREHPRREQRIAEIPRNVARHADGERPGHRDRQREIQEESRRRGDARRAESSSRFSFLAFSGFRDHIGLRDYSDSMIHRMAGLSAAIAAVVTSVSLTAASGRPGGAATEPQGAQTPRRTIGTVLGALDRVRGFHETAISPDGRRVAWVEDVAATAETTAIFVRTIAVAANAQNGESAETHRVTVSGDGKGHRENGVAWAPDSHTLAFLSDGGSPGQQQLYVIDVDSNTPARRVTSAKGQLAQPLWSPDGKQLAVLFVAGSTQGTGALVAVQTGRGRRRRGVGGAADCDRRSRRRRHARGRARQTCSSTTTTGRPTARRSPPKRSKDPARTTTGSRSSTSSSAGSGKTTSIWKPPLQIAGPRWSPDGRSIAVIHGIMSDEGQTGGDIYVVPASGGAARNVTPGLEGSARTLAWRPDGRLHLSGIRRRSIGAGHGCRGRRQSDHGMVRAAGDGHAWLDRGTASRCRRRAVVQSFQRGAGGRTPARSARGRAQTHATPPSNRCGARSRACTGRATSIGCRAGCCIRQTSIRRRSIRWSSRCTAARRRRISRAGRRAGTRCLPAQGYFVLLPNPRGSYGQGEAFTQANVKDFGYGDLRDIDRRRRRGGEGGADRSGAHRHHRLELRRLHDDVGGDADDSVQGGGRGRGDRELAELLRAEQDRHVDAAVLRRVGLRRARGLRAIVADHLHQEGEDADARPARRPRLRGARRRRATSSGTR